MEVQDDEINLMDLWQVIRKRLHFVIIFSLLVSILALGISLRLPKIYEGEAIMALPKGGGLLVSAVETKAIIDVVIREVNKKNPIDGFDKDLIDYIDDIKIDPVKGSETNFKLVVQVKREPLKAYEVFSKVINYLQNNEYVVKRINLEKATIEANIKETKQVIENAVKTRNEAVRLISSRNPVGFNPVDLDIRVSELRTKLIGLETVLSTLKGYEFINPPHVYKNKIKPKVAINTILAGVAALFASLILVFIMEGIEKQKTR